MTTTPGRNIVLIVDDDTSMLRSLTRLVQQSGFVTLTFPSAEAFSNHRDFEKVACVLLDINLGDGSGIEVRQRLTAANVSVPVIYMSAEDDPAIRAAALRSGCFAFLEKPVPAKSLTKLLRSINSLERPKLEKRLELYRHTAADHRPGESKRLVEEACANIETQIAERDKKNRP